jgi:hypothetical protein
MPWFDTWRGHVWGARDGASAVNVPRNVPGRPYEMPVRCTNEKAALERLEWFERDPDGYDPGTALAGEPIRLNTDLALDLLCWSRDAKGNSAEWIGKQKRDVPWTHEILGKDLRRVTLVGDLVPALRRARAEAAEAFYAWVREERRGRTRRSMSVCGRAGARGEDIEGTPGYTHRKLFVKVLRSGGRTFWCSTAPVGVASCGAAALAASGPVGPLPKNGVADPRTERPRCSRPRGGRAGEVPRLKRAPMSQGSTRTRCKGVQ